jgi:hypothetical protein
MCEKVKIVKEEGLKEQTGFVANRGTIDVHFATNVRQKKRNKRILEALFAVLRRNGLPNLILNIVIRLNRNVKTTLKTGSVDSELESSIGVRQGSCKGSVLFLFIMQAAFETMRWPVPKLELCTHENGVAIGERVGRKG